ncbi:MAG TPA: thioredoxin domain-containing protein [Acidimicrobiales bacterium]|nr:thioredoxin domain-containing protein [Acidimicrobiales bacterium]
MNRLASEASPYLRQHRDNPVDWHPWGDDAFAEARERDVPILLSIGYSACHWCHVMAHESFEDDATAGVMNRLFVNVKVDREERPDVDAVYMEAVQALTGRGGWPMTVFLTPEGEPFFAGTYFPPTPRGGLPAFTELLEAVDDAWRNRRPEVAQQAADLSGAIAERSTLGTGAVVAGGAGIGPSLLEGGYAQVRAGFDAEWGGLGQAPKFPMPSSIDFLLRVHHHNGSDDTLAMVTTTLDAMASGGIYDHLGGGFARYSVDRVWLVPHFEKMLYDQAGLVRLYLHGWQVAEHDRWRQVVEETVAYVLRDLRTPEGGLYSAEDADSEGEEGKFYVWHRDELPDVAAEWYGATARGNFEHGTTILNRMHARGDVLRPPEVEAARKELFERREQRVRPGLDDKVLTEWNAMFVASLAEAAAAMGRDDWLAAAVEIAEFLIANLRGEHGRWHRSWQRDAGARHLAYAVDYAWLVDAFVRLAEATGQARWIDEARAAADGLVDLFHDTEGEGFFTVGRDGEALIVRQKDLYDGATPSANSVAAVALLRLAALTGDERYLARGEGVLALLRPALEQQPSAFTHALAAVDLTVSGVDEVAITGERPDLVAAVQRRYLPNAVLAWGERYDSPLWEGRADGLAYVCRSFTCQAPVDSATALVEQLAGPSLAG